MRLVSDNARLCPEYLNRVGDIFPAALRRSSGACNPNLGFGSKSASIPRPLAAGFLILCLNDGENQIRVKQFATIGVQQANINPTNLGTLLLAIPQKITEQKQIIEDISASIDCQRDTNTNLRKLQSLKIGLMQDLLTGNVRVTALLNDQEIAKI